MNYLRNFYVFILYIWGAFHSKPYHIRNHMYRGLNLFCQPSAMRFQTFPAERVQNRIHRNFP